MVVVSAVCNSLNPSSEEYFRRTRERDLGKKLEDVCGEEEWEKVEQAWGFVASWLDKDEEGKEDLFMGDRICFADLTVVGALLWIKESHGHNSEGWNRVAKMHGGRWKAIVDRFEKYSAVH